MLVTALNPHIGYDKAAQIAGSSAFWADSVLARFVRDLRVQTLHENVDQLQAVVNDVGTLLSGLPGAGRLLKRGGREVRSSDNKTSISPPE